MTAEKEITKILYQNSIDCSEGMVIDFKDIQKVLKLLTDDKLEFAKYHVDKALNKASEKSLVYQHSRDFQTSRKAPIVRQKIMISEVDKDSILNAYPLKNIK